MEQLRFKFKIRRAADGKLTILCLTIIGTPNGRCFTVPEKYQNVNMHKELIASEIFSRVRNTLKKRKMIKIEEH